MIHKGECFVISVALRWVRRINKYITSNVENYNKCSFSVLLRVTHFPSFLMASLDVPQLVHELALGAEEMRWVNVRSLLCSSSLRSLIDNIKYTLGAFSSST